MNWQSVITSIGGPLLNTIGTVVAGPMGGRIAETAGQMIAEALGVEPTPQAVANAPRDQIETAVQAVVSDPARMAAIAAVIGEETKREAARLADVQDARRTMTDMQRQGAAIAWAPVLVSTIIFVIWGGLLVAVVGKPLQFSDAQWQIVNIAFGSASGLAVQVANYWLGSSNGSRTKDGMIEQALAATRGGK